jgi:hypothetical protein
LQNVAVISSMQKTPVVGAWLGAGVGAGRTPWVADCDWPFDVARCATAGEAAKAEKTSAAISVSLFISTIRFGPTLRCVTAKIVAKEFEKETKPLPYLFRAFRRKLASWGARRFQSTLSLRFD